MTHRRLELSFLFSFALLLHVHAQDQDYFTNISDAVVFTPNWRFIKNEVKEADFQGYSDVWSSPDGSVFTTDLAVTSGQAWPQITEGTTGGDANRFTPGYPITVSSYLTKQNDRLLVFNGTWTKRTNGGGNPGNPTGDRFVGAYIWLNNPTNIWPGGNPKWPFAIEVNIWNRHDLNIGSQPWNYEKTYYDFDGGYKVSGGPANVDGDKFDRFFFLLDEPAKDSMNVNVKKVLEYMKNEISLNTSLEIISISVAAEGHKGADGKFVASIDSMARP